MLCTGTVGTECTLVHCSLYTGCICRALNPREPRNQVVNLQNIATGTTDFVPRSRLKRVSSVDTCFDYCETGGVATKPSVMLNWRRPILWLR